MLHENGINIPHGNEVVMLKKDDYERLKRNAKEAEVLRTAVIKLLEHFKANQTNDVEVTRKEFLAIYGAAVDDLFRKEDNGDDDDNEIYGHDVTVHWHGIFCNCEDGATVTNTVIDGVECCSSELGD